jgi:hypothetical protein
VKAPPAFNSDTSDDSKQPDTQAPIDSAATEQLDAPKLKRGAQPGNQNHFKHGLAILAKKRSQGRVPRGKAKRFRREFYNSLVADAGGAKIITAAKKYQAMVISNDADWLNLMIEARDNLLRDKPQIGANIAALSKLDSYIRPVINSISAALDRFGYERKEIAPKSLEDIFNEPGDADTEEE